MEIENLTIINDTESKEAYEIAKKGTHCGMCRFDFLETGYVHPARIMAFLHIGHKVECRYIKI